MTSTQGPPSSRGVAIRDRDDATRWLSAGVWLSRVVPPTNEELRRVVPWIVAALGERLDLPPLGVVADVGAILHGETMSRPARVPHAKLDGAIRRYEDSLLGRLGADSRMRSCADAIAKLPEDLRARGVAIFVASLMDHLGFDLGATIQPGVVRSATARSNDLASRGAAAIGASEDLRSKLEAAYEALARGAKRASTLVTDADVFTLENLAVLRTLTQRLAIAQVVHAREAIGAALKNPIRTKRRSTGDSATRDETESEYPIGGFASVSTSGSIENVVTSELVYMDAGGSASKRDAVDLFDVRYAEGELLYYTRDEAILRRQRRLVTFLLAGDLASARVKDGNLPWQRVVALLATIGAVVDKLVRDLGHEALAFRVVFVRDDAHPPPLDAEREILTLLFRELRDKGMLAIVESTLDKELAHLAIEARRALVEIVACSAREGALDVAAQKIVVAPLVAGSADLAAWQAQAVEVVAQLL